MTLDFQDYGQHVQQLIQAALAAVDPAVLISKHLSRDGRSLLVSGDPGSGTHVTRAYDLGRGRIYLISVGKAAGPMAMTAAELLAQDLGKGIVITKQGSKDWRAEIEGLPLTQYEAGHPVSNEDSIRATQATVEMLDETTAEDLVLCLISGGTSALLTQPLVPLADWQQLTDALLASGCTINDFNRVRRQLDHVKGGGLARLAAPATCISLILSDVVGNPLEIIGSGPTVPGADTAQDALDVLTRYDVDSALETAVWRRISQTLNRLQEDEAPPPAVQNLIVGDVRQAARAAASKAEALGFASQILTTHLEGEAREVGRVAAAIGKDMPPGHCFILGGETTVTLRGNGIGGRNQEVALAAAIALEAWPYVAIAAFATDGEDGLTDAAGAIVTGETAELARTQHLEPVAFLNDNDSYTFFKQVEERIRGIRDREHSYGECLIQTGSTGTNVNDLLFILAYPHST